MPTLTNRVASCPPPAVNSPVIFSPLLSCLLFLLPSSSSSRYSNSSSSSWPPSSSSSSSSSCRCSSSSSSSTCSTCSGRACSRCPGLHLARPPSPDRPCNRQVRGGASWGTSLVWTLSFYVITDCICFILLCVLLLAASLVVVYCLFFLSPRLIGAFFFVFISFSSARLCCFSFPLSIPLFPSLTSSFLCAVCYCCLLSSVIARHRGNEGKRERE